MIIPIGISSLPLQSSIRQAAEGIHRADTLKFTLAHQLFDCQTDSGTGGSVGIHIGANHGLGHLIEEEKGAQA